jgi:TDG/mug DNA glycosylase family protein
MEIIHSFPPVARADARLIVLGSMPGKMSLARQEYYAHPRNVFWRIAGELFHFNHEAPYDQRKSSLMMSRVALWDVMAACSRSSSLDSDIVESSIIANDFKRFFPRHPEIRAVFFNGLKAEQCYRKFVEPGLDGQRALPGLRLPSTSPANAGISFENKLEAWRVILDQGKSEPGPAVPAPE